MHHDKQHEGSIAWMAQRPIAANLAMIVLLLGGVWALAGMQKEVYPQFLLDTVQISVGYPGAAPAEVEQGILRPVEEALRGVQGIQEITSEAREGRGSVEVELVAGSERMRVFQDIDQAVNRIRTFPDDIDQPEVQLRSTQREVLTVVLYGETGVWELRRLAEELRDRLLSDPAITQVELGNAPDYMTHIEIPAHRLREYGLTLDQVARTIERSSADIPAGALESRAGEILLRVSERRQWAEEFAAIEILNDPRGGALTLGELAEIRDAFEETRFHGQFNRQPSIDLDVFRVGDQSPLKIAAAVEAILEEVSLPEGVRHRIDSNTAEDFGERLRLLTKNGLLAVVIVLVVLAFFLELKLAFWVMAGMVISFIGAILFLPFLGITLNMISMFGFLIVMGIVVDDAVVVGENVYEYRLRGYSPLRAAIEGTRDVSRPVVFSILTNIIAFVPLLYIPGETGMYWWSLPVVVIVVLALSLFEALYILPAHLAHVSAEKGTEDRGVAARLQAAFRRRYEALLHGPYKRFLEFSLRFRYITLSTALAGLLLMGGYAFSDHMGMILMPASSADEIEAGVRLPVGTTPDKAAELAAAVTDSTWKMFEEHALHEAAEGVKTNVRGGRFIDVELVMRPPDQREMSAQEVIELWRDEIGDIEGVQQITFEAERGPGGWRQDISIDLSHADIAVLEEAALSLVEELKTFENARDVSDNLNRGKAQFDFRLLPEGRNLGLDAVELGRQLRDAFHGALALRHLRGTNEVEVRVRLPKEERQSLQQLKDFVIQLPGGGEVPLLEVAEITEGEAYSTISRRNGRRVVNVGMDAQPANAVSRLLSSVNGEVLPALRERYPGLTWTFEGSQAEMRESTRMLWSGFGLAMVVIYALLAIAFNSYTQPLIVMGAIPFGFFGALVGHMLLGVDLSLVSVMGVLALAGVVLNDSLIMVDYANRHGKGSPREAIRDAGLRRFRPILLTTLTTFGGLTPIILESSRQAYHLIPMAISLGFGILFATSIILVIVPCLYLVHEDLRGLVQRAPGRESLS